MALDLAQFSFIRPKRGKWTARPAWVPQLEAAGFDVCSRYVTESHKPDDLEDIVELGRPNLHDLTHDSSKDQVGKHIGRSKNIWLRCSKLQDERGNLHCDNGSALWSGDIRLFFLHGVYVPDSKFVLLPPEQLDSKEILALQNVDLRRELIRKVGIELFLDQMFHRIIDTQGDYQLIQILLNDNVRQPSTYLKMLNPSIGVWHLEGVPNNCATVEAALLHRNNNWFAHADILT